MAEEKEKQQEQGKQSQAVKLRVDLPDVITETYAKAYLAYRISLENWFLLNEILAFIKNEKLSAKEVQNRLQKLFSVINTEIVKELVKLNQMALVKTASAGTEEKGKEKNELREENNG
ncbi:MAG: hypothetical protein ABGX27_09100 [Desulfurobacteriaceae bacterium]